VPEHEAFGETAGAFLDEDALPFHEQWEGVGVVAARWARAGARGLRG
jgi:hypothetical protein